MPEYIDPRWEYREDNEEIIEVAFSNTQHTKIDSLAKDHYEGSKDKYSGYRLGRGNPDWFNGRLAREKPTTRSERTSNVCRTCKDKVHGSAKYCSEECRTKFYDDLSIKAANEFLQIANRSGMLREVCISHDISYSRVKRGLRLLGVKLQTGRPRTAKPPLVCVCKTCSREFHKRHSAMGMYCSARCYQRSVVGRVCKRVKTRLKKIPDLYNLGERNSEIMRLLDIKSASTLERLLRESGVKRRPQGNSTLQRNRDMETRSNQQRMTLGQAQEMMLSGSTLGDVYQHLSPEDKLEIKEWFVREPLVPIRQPSPTEQILTSRDMGYTGDICSYCNGMRMRRTGGSNCQVCDDCGTQGGC